ncbi:MAG: energy transducer TonB [Rhodothermales bacterium]
MRHTSNHTYQRRHSMHMMASMVVSLLLLIATVKLWPLPSEGDPSNRTYSTRGQETIQMEEIVPTRQVRQTPPPPAPLPPIVVPNDEIIEEVELDIEDSFLAVEDPGVDAEIIEGPTEGTPTTLARADTGPKPVRIVEPEYTRAAKRKRVRAEVVVEVLVDERGRVQETKVLERFLLNGKDNPKKPVNELGYGLEEAALGAAQRWLFRPARQNGTPVRSYHSLTFRFGV